jgi:hypothetical protein
MEIKNYDHSDLDKNNIVVQSTRESNSVDFKERNLQHIQKPLNGGICMKGSIFYQKDRKKWAIDFYHNGRSYIITRYKGETMSDKRYAEKCLALIQGRYEQYTEGLCSFRIEEFIGKGQTDVLPYFEEWMKQSIIPSRKPSTVKSYWSYYYNWIEPFFTEHNIMLHEIQLDTLTKLKNFLNLSPKGKINVMNCLHRMMDFLLCRSSRLPCFA